MALRIEGDHYRIEWDEEQTEWVGYVRLFTQDGDSYRYPDVRVWSAFELEEVMKWVINYLDDLANHFKQEGGPKRIMRKGSSV